MKPVSAPRSNVRFKGNTATVVRTPLNISERSFVEEKDASLLIAVCTPILLAVVPDINSFSYKARQWTGSMDPLKKKKVKYIIIAFFNPSSLIPITCVVRTSSGEGIKSKILD